MTGDQRTIQQWTVRIGGIDQKTVKPGRQHRNRAQAVAAVARMTAPNAGDSGRHAVHVETPCDLAVSQNGGGTVRDLGSTNGTYVEGHQVPAATLLDGNTITIGRTRILFWASSREQE